MFYCVRLCPLWATVEIDNVGFARNYTRRIMIGQLKQWGMECCVHVSSRSWGGRHKERLHGRLAKDAISEKNGIL
jgi:hypothetical protein